MHGDSPRPGLLETSGEGDTHGASSHGTGDVRSILRTASEAHSSLHDRRSFSPTTGEAGRTIEKAPESGIIAKAAPTVPVRDWVKAPAIVEHTPAGAVFAASDLHGRYEESFKLFEGNKMLRGSIDKPGEVEWIGGTATVVIVGDLINKGDGSVKIIDMLRALQTSAEKKGGKVIVTMGNHEALFFHQPRSARSLRNGTEGKYGFGYELMSRGVSLDSVVSGTDPEGRGKWLQELPFGAKVGEYFFVHSGNTRGMNREALGSAIQRAISDQGFGHEEIVGLSPSSVLGADDWRLTAAEAKSNAEKLGVKHIVMGHIPYALDAKRAIGKSLDGALIKLDTGLGNGEGPARMLRVSSAGKVKQVDVDGVRTKLQRQGASP